MFTREIEKIVETLQIQETDYNLAIEASKESHKPIYVELSKAFPAKESDIYKELCEGRSLHYVDISNFDVDPTLFMICGEDVCKKHNILPFKKGSDGHLTIISSNVDTYDICNTLSFSLGLKVKAVIAGYNALEILMASSFSDGLDDLGEELEHEDFTLEAMDDDDDDGDDGVLDISKQDSSKVIRLVNHIFMDAIANKVSDIHIEAGEFTSSVRYRADGVLHTKRKFGKPLHGSVVSRLKILAKMNIANSRSPQDGRMRISIQSRSYDLRISTLPCFWGEKVVMRILDKSALSLSYASIGFSDRDLAVVNESISKSTGALLVTGPTGSGKTTTLYSILGEKNTPGVNIITVEDPVEFQIKGINQVQVNEKAGLTFEASLRSILRQDPDIVMVGEIRDHQTAEIAFHAAQTGHLVLSTLHTNDAPSTITRLIEMELDPALISASVNGVIAQRLIRRLCNECKKPQSIDDNTLKAFNFDPDVKMETYMAVGCPKCNHIGYKGRCAVHEVLEVNDDIIELIISKAGSNEIEKAARSHGMLSLFEAGLSYVLRGQTSYAEVTRSLTPPEGLDLQGRIDGDKLLPAGVSVHGSDSNHDSNIILVDDNNSTSEVVSHILNKVNIDVAVCEASRTAFNLIKAEKIDVLVAKAKMPEISGIELLVNIKKLEGAKSKIPVVIITDSSTEKSEAYARGASVVISEGELHLLPSIMRSLIK